jgi:uncharacterized protein YjbI with pentapeptide repeats
MKVEMTIEEVLNRYARGERNFPAINFSEANLSGINLSKASLCGANLSVANLCGSNLSEADLSWAKLNVAKLSGANLSKANLYEANLNVTNLTLADLSQAVLRQASLVRAEMARADLSEANLSQANLSGADIKDARLREANLSHANLNRADLKRAVFTDAILTHANLHGADLSSADLSGADLSNTELRQANLCRANLRGANLSGANLRWADLSGADLSWADLSGARLSGANLTGVNLSSTNLLGTILVHADLTRASLIDADWAGADLSGATLTGAKLHGVLRFGVKTDGLLCEWIDLSPNGDQSNICRLTAEKIKDFFQEAPPTIRMKVDAPLDIAAHHGLAMAYYQLSQRYAIALPPPNIRIGRRRTTLTFELSHDEHLFLAAYLVSLPFQDSMYLRHNLMALLEMLQPAKLTKQAANLSSTGWLTQTLAQVGVSTTEIAELAASQSFLEKIKFFHAPIQVTLTTSKNQPLTLYSHPEFGKRMQNSELTAFTDSPDPAPRRRACLPTLSALIDFIQGFKSTNLAPLSQVQEGAGSLS